MVLCCSAKSPSSADAAIKCGITLPMHSSCALTLASSGMATARCRATASATASGHPPVSTPTWSAPCSRRHSTASRSPPLTATCSAVPMLPAASGSAPACSSDWTAAAGHPLWTARTRAELPWSSAAFGSAPSRSRLATTRGSLRGMALCSSCWFSILADPTCTLGRRCSEWTLDAATLVVSWEGECHRTVMVPSECSHSTTPLRLGTSSPASPVVKTSSPLRKAPTERLLSALRPSRTR
mmetsp:Transcript_29343/g.70668  ORF Transcript_29343/g.70668 Transcript_29343/m.70668 type:complete len:240 (-) Transcript_29343:138-857(-)